MKISYNWLRELVDLEGISPLEAADKLTDAGVECDGVYPLSSATGLIIGEIVSCVAIEGTHLHTLLVDEGEKYGKVQIVCGAPNARVGLKVIVARPGAELPGGKIGESSLHGVMSYGMCCSLQELGIEKKFLSDAQVSGIEELPSDAPVGEENVLGYLGLDDSVLELEVLPSRTDILSARGIARELAALFGRNLKWSEEKYDGTFVSEYWPGSDSKDCPQFLLREVRGIKNAPSPKWLSSRLLASGIRSINAVVDIGNYAMLLMGRPLNMYDADKVHGKKLVAKAGYKGQWLGMDGKTYELSEEDLGICDEKGVACLAGILTSEEAMVDEKTENVLVECAVFNGPRIRKTSARLGLSSDSSARYVRGIDPEAANETLALVSRLLVELTGATAVSQDNVYDVTPHKPTKVAFDIDYINARLGTELPEEKIIEVLSSDWLEIKSLGKGKYEATVPSYRPDIQAPCDLSEEVIRLIGYDAIEEKFPRMPLSQGGLTAYQQKRKDVRTLLGDRGLYEALTYTLVGEKEKDAFDLLNPGRVCHVVANPLAPERKYVRKNILPSLLETLSYNAAHQNEDVAFYEVSDIDYVGGEGERLAVAAYGYDHGRGALEKRPYSYYFVKGIYEALLDLLGLAPTRFRLVPLTKEEAGEELHPYRSVYIMSGKEKIGVFGELHPKAVEAYGLKGPSSVLEIDLAYLLNMPGSAKKAIVPPKYPKVKRDLSLLCPFELRSEDILTAIKKSSALIKEAEVFDVYQGKGVEEGYKSLAVSMALYDPQRTLVDKEVDEAVNKAVEALKKLKAEVRG